MIYRFNKLKGIWEYHSLDGTWQYSPQYNARAPRPDVLKELEAAGHTVIPFNSED